MCVLKYATGQVRYNVKYNLQTPQLQAKTV